MSISEELMEIQNLKEKLNSLKTSSPITFQEEAQEIPFLSEVQKELQILRRELTSFCKEGNPDQSQESSCCKILLGLYEENFRLKAECKSLRETHNSPMSTEKQVVGLIHKLKNENADISHEINIYKNKELSVLTKIEEMELKMMKLKRQLAASKEETNILLEKISELSSSSEAEESVSAGKLDLVNQLASSLTGLLDKSIISGQECTHKKSKDKNSLDSSKSILKIPNRKTSRTKNEQIFYVTLNETFQVMCSFDEMASISVCGPHILQYYESKALKPALFTHYQFSSGDLYECLGVIEVDLVRTHRNVSLTGCRIHIFKEVEVLVLNRYHWTGSSTIY